MKNMKFNVGSFATAKLQAKMLRILAIIAIIAVFGFSFATCEDDTGPGGGGGGGGTYQGYTIKSGSPPSTTLAKYGITSADIQGLLNAARAADDPDFQGYYEFNLSDYGSSVDTVSYLGLVWYNKSEAKFKSVCNTCKSTVENNDGYWADYSYSYSSMFDSGPADVDTLVAIGFYSDNTSSYYNCVMLYKDGYSDVPQNTLVVVYMKMTGSDYGYGYDDDDDY